MKKYTCPCGYVYDEALGDPENGIPAGTKWEDLPGSFQFDCSKKTYSWEALLCKKYIFLYSLISILQYFP